MIAASSGAYECHKGKCCGNDQHCHIHKTSLALLPNERGGIDGEGNTGHVIGPAPVVTCAQFCMSITSARSTTAISTDDRKSAPPAPSAAAADSAVARPSGEAMITSAW